MTTRTGVLAVLLLLPIAAALGCAPQRAAADAKSQTPRAAAIAAGKKPAPPTRRGQAPQADKFVVVVGYATPLLIRRPRRAPVTAKLRSPGGPGKHTCPPLPHSS